MSEIISDTLLITISHDSSSLNLKSLPIIQDNRKKPSTFLGTRQIKKGWIIPVDQHFVLNEPLSDLFNRLITKEATGSSDTLVIENISIWYDSNPVFSKGWMLNGYTRLVNNDGITIKDWQWEFRSEKERKKKTEEIIGHLMLKWVAAQKRSLTAPNNLIPISPHLYRRQLLLWFDTIYLQDGYILDGRLSLDFPSDRMDSFIRGVPGIYYRKSSVHESLAIGGKDQQWFYRIGSSWLGRLNITGRIGFNNFNKDKFDYIDWWNIFLINTGLTVGMEYHPVYVKGLFIGGGIHQSINILPEIVKRTETGVLFSIGIVLP